jgi:predicted ArsR family transcriptional regulator
MGVVPEADPRARILAFVKTRDGAFVRDVAEHFQTTHEGARKHLIRMEEDGWLERRPVSEGVGRPRDVYAVTAAGDRLLPKAYDTLSLAMLAGLREGPAGVREMLAGLARRQVEAWKPRLQGKPVPEKLEALRALYAEQDPFVSLEISEREARFTERNCPFLNVALEQPALCSLTVNTLEGLLGHPVIREEKFQAGHGRCVFRILLDQELPEGVFTLESERPPARAA